MGLVSGSQNDALILTGTRLHVNVLNAEIGILIAPMYKCERNPPNTSRLRGDGVMIAINNKYVPNILSIDLELALVSVNN